MGHPQSCQNWHSATSDLTLQVRILPSEPLEFQCGVKVPTPSTCLHTPRVRDGKHDAVLQASGLRLRAWLKALDDRDDAVVSDRAWDSKLYAGADGRAPTESGGEANGGIGK